MRAKIVFVYINISLTFNVFVSYRPPLVDPRPLQSVRLDVKRSTRESWTRE